MSGKACPKRRRPHMESLERDISFDLLESLKDGGPAPRPDADGRRTFLPQRTITSFERGRPFSDPLPHPKRNLEVGHFHYFGPCEIPIFLHFFLIMGMGTLRKERKEWKLLRGIYIILNQFK